MAVKYTNIFHCKTHQNLPKLRFFCFKICHLATLAECTTYVKLLNTFNGFMFVSSLNEKPAQLTRNKLSRYFQCQFIGANAVNSSFEQRNGFTAFAALYLQLFRFDFCSK
jgi:hypothetical protein